MTNKHTPGPWILNIDTVHIPRHVNGVSVKVQPAAFHGDSQGMADARLIAAAPDLLEALIAAERAMQADISDVDIGATFEQVRTAIAKAHGHATRE